MFSVAIFKNLFKIRRDNSVPSIQYLSTNQFPTQTLIDIDLNLTCKSKFPVAKFVTAVKQYKHIYGDPYIHKAYIINDLDQWNSDLVGYDLGKQSQSFRILWKNERFRSLLRRTGADTELLNLGFKTSYIEQQQAVVLQSLIIYQQLFSTLHLPRSYRIPNETTITIKNITQLNPFPKASYNLLLGKIASNIRSNGFYLNIHENLKQIHFPFEKLKQKWKIEKIILACEIYFSIYGTIKIPKSLIIESSDERFPDDIRGMKLGIILYHIRNKNSFPQYYMFFENLGLDFNIRRPYGLSYKSENNESNEKNETEIEISDDFEIEYENNE